MTTTREVEDRLRETLNTMAATVAVSEWSPAPTVPRHRPRLRSLPGVAVAAGAFIVVLAAFVPLVLLFMNGSGRSAVSAPSELSTAAPTTAGSGADGAGVVPLSAVPLLGLDLPGWVLSEAGEDEGGFLRTVTYYLPTADETQPAEYAQLSIQGLVSGSVHEAGMWWMTRTDYETVTVHGHQARLFVSDGGYTFVWRESAEAVATLAVFSVSGPLTRDQGLAAADGVVGLSQDEWARALAAANPVPDSPTTTLAPDSGQH